MVPHNFGFSEAPDFIIRYHLAACRTWSNPAEVFPATRRIQSMSARFVNIDHNTPMLLPPARATGWPPITWSTSSWTPVHDNIPGTDGIVQVTDSNGAGQAKRFYRIAVVP